MQCQQARRALDDGMTPGTQTAARVQLGFHLAQCAECRAHGASAQQRPHSPTLVAPTAYLLPHPLLQPVAQAAEKRSARRSLAPWLLLGSAALLLLVALGVAVARQAQALFQTHQNVQAMVVATDTATPTVTLTPSPLPTATVTPSPLPSATPTLVPTATLVPTPVPPDPGGAVTIALLGSDRRPGEAGAARSDAIIVLRVDPIEQRVAMLSLPRDLHVRIPGHGSGRINGATAFARDDIAAGADTARATISGVLGIPIDYYVTVDFRGFIDAIDAMGGVTVNVERSLYDGRFPTMDYRYAEVSFERGAQQFDGRSALVYSRIRHPDSDFARMKRQQAVLVGVLGSLREQGIGGQIAQLEATTTALRGYVSTDIPEDRMIGLAWALRDITPEAVERYTLQASQVSFGVGSDRWAETPKPGVLQVLVGQLVGQ